MARIKYYDKTTQTWKYANTPFGGSPMEVIDEYVANANTFLTAGTIKTNTTTLNLPYSGSTQDQLGALLYLPEDGTNGTGMQIWGCVAENSSTHKNEIWRRVITNGKTQNPTYGTWERVTKPSGGWSDSDFTTAVQSVLDLAESALQPSALTAYRTSSAQDVIDGGKATKVTSATNGDLAALDSNGNLTDSGKKVSDFRLSADSLTYSDLSNSVQLSLDKADQAETDIDGIEAKIPTQASAQNQLGDKNFINSSIATNTANYISNNGQPFTSVAQLEAYTGTVTNNDYAFVTGTDASGNAYYDRYKATVSGSTVTWANEFRLNNSSFTAAQWAAITSGITSVLVSFLSAQSHETWTFTLDDLTTVTKEVVVWTSQA